MEWEVIFHPEFFAEFEALSENIQDGLLIKTLFLQKYGPQLGRPHVDTLYGSTYVNMKELRVNIENGVWRIAFAFDPDRKAILLFAGNKIGVKPALFYQNLIQIAAKRFKSHLTHLSKR